MAKTERGGATHLFETEHARVYMADPNALAMYGKYNDDAWIASQAPLSLRNWR